MTLKYFLCLQPKESWWGVLAWQNPTTVVTRLVWRPKLDTSLQTRFMYSVAQRHGELIYLFFIISSVKIRYTHGIVNQGNRLWFPQGEKYRQNFNNGGTSLTLLTMFLEVWYSKPQLCDRISCRGVGHEYSGWLLVITWNARETFLSNVNGIHHHSTHCML